jgi:hypothetical protein
MGGGGYRRAAGIARYIGLVTDESPGTREPERLFARKYAKSDAMDHDGRHAWLRLVPGKVTSWDFRLLFPARTTPAQQKTTP